MRKFTRCKEMILIVISDGQPNATGYKSDAGVGHTRQAVRSLSRDMFVVQIAIDPAVASSRMFDHYLELPNLSALPGRIGSILGKLLTI